MTKITFGVRSSCFIVVREDPTYVTINRVIDLLISGKKSV